MTPADDKENEDVEDHQVHPPPRLQLRRDLRLRTELHLRQGLSG